MSAIHCPSLTLTPHLRPGLDFRYGVARCILSRYGNVRIVDSKCMLLYLVYALTVLICMITIGLLEACLALTIG